MKKHLLIGLVLLIMPFSPGSHLASAQAPGGVRKMKPKKPNTTPALTGATQPESPGQTQPSARTHSGTPPAAPSSQSSGKAAASGFKEVSKEKFKEIYFRLGGGKKSGWSADYWQEFFVNKAQPGWKFMVEEPKSARHIRMFIVTDTKAKEYRLFFMTEEEEDDSFDWPG